MCTMICMEASDQPAAARAWIAYRANGQGPAAE